MCRITEEEIKKIEEEIKKMSDEELIQEVECSLRQVKRLFHL
jgi:hypothetical protein